MDSLDDTFGPRVSIGGRRTRLIGGALLLLGGLPVAAVAFHRLVLDFLMGSVGAAAAAQSAIALSGLFVPAVSGLAVLRLPASRVVKLAAVGGVVIAALATALFLITVPTAAFQTGAVPTTVQILYLTGTVVAVGAPFATIAAALSSSDDRRASVTGSPGGEGGGSGHPSTAMPTDGGYERNRLEFLLDDDR